MFRVNTLPPLFQIAARILTHKSRLSDDWLPSVDNLLFAESEGLTASEINHEAAKFRDYWISAPGQKGVKLDWAATWRNWVRMAKPKANGHAEAVPLRREYTPTRDQPSEEELRRKYAR
jgi:hypothetical protein